MRVSTFRSRLALVLALVLAVSTSAGTARADIVSDVTDAELAAEWQLSYILYQFIVRLPAPSLLSLRKQVLRTLSIEIDEPIDHVFDVYSDIDNHIGRHPFLKSVTTHQEYVSNGVHVRNFTAIEDVPIAGVPVRLHTHAQQRTYASAYYYEADSHDAPDVITHQRITFVDLGGGRTRVTESLVFETNAALIDFTVQNGVAAHQTNMQILKADLESGAL
jgi:hypothetical protein